MEQETFNKYVEQYAPQIETIRQSAHALHASVNQTYGDELPYGYHLDMVVKGIHRCFLLAIITTASRTPV